MFNFKIYNWMSKSLNLKKFNLLIFAYIYSFTSRKNSYFECTIHTISQNLGISKNAVVSALKYLSDCNYLIKTTYINNNFKHVKYAYNCAVINKMINKCEETQRYNPSSFITIYDWMVTVHKLSGYELIIFALIYSFSCSRIGYFKGSIDYICQRFNMDKSTAYRILNKLESNHAIKLVSGKGNTTKIYTINPDYTSQTAFTDEVTTNVKNFLNNKTKLNTSTVNNNLKIQPYVDLDSLSKSILTDKSDVNYINISKSEEEKVLQLLKHSIIYFCYIHDISFDELSNILEEEYISISQFDKIVEFLKKQ